jgi:hypothetical protein
MHHAFTNAALADIVALEAPHGIVSVYASIDLESRDRVRIEFDHAARDAAQARGEAVPAAELKAALEVARKRMQDALVGRSASVAAIAGFIPVGAEDDAVWVAAPEVEATLVVHDSVPFLLPLLRTMELYGAGGVVTLAMDRVVVYEWADGRLEEAARHEVEVDTDQWRSTDGPFNATAASGSGGAGGRGARSTITSHDAFNDKVEAEAIAQLSREVAPVIDELARSRRWDRIIWFGTPQSVAAVRRSLSQDGIVRHVEGGDAIVVAAQNDGLRERVRAATERHWLGNAKTALKTVAERPPSERVEDLDEAATLARDGRIGDLYVHAPERPVATDEARRINALVGEVVRRGGQVHALPQDEDAASRNGNGGSEQAAGSILATLRW